MSEEEKLIELISDARFVFICGNGGSASTAEHFSSDLLFKKIPAICLNSNVSAITMIANDYGYDKIFSIQLSRYATEDDLLITISCSGTSANIVEAQEYAEMLGMTVYKFETFKKGEPNYEELEDKHLQLIHRIRKLL